MTNISESLLALTTTDGTAFRAQRKMSIELIDAKKERDDGSVWIAPTAAGLDNSTTVDKDKDLLARHRNHTNYNDYEGKNKLRCISEDDQHLDSPRLSSEKSPRRLKALENAPAKSPRSTSTNDRPQSPGIAWSSFLFRFCSVACCLYRAVCASQR
jgi:hypothetical protein